MCVVVPGLVLSIDGDFARIDFVGIQRRVCVSLLPELSVDEYVIVNANYANEGIKPEEAKKTLALIEEMASISQEMTRK